MESIRLSELISDIDDTLQSRYSGEAFWIKAEICDVKKQPDKRWCFLKLIEKEGRNITAEIKAVFWSNAYASIEKFEAVTRQNFVTGLQIVCCVRVRFHQRYGLDLEVLDIDVSTAVEKPLSEREITLARLVKEHPSAVRLYDGQYYTANKKLELPIVIQRVALITAPESDGQRDFQNEIRHNALGYRFKVTEFLTQIQGENSSALLVNQLRRVEQRRDEFDVVAIVRGGGSETDFKPFEDYDLARTVILFPLPVLTGIGHDRNTSIVDMMARQHKTPTKVASSIVDHNFQFERELIDIRERLVIKAKNKVNSAMTNLSHITRTIKAYSPATILKKGYAVVTRNDRIIVDPRELSASDNIITILKEEAIHSTINTIAKDGTDLS